MRRSWYAAAAALAFTAGLAFGGADDEQPAAAEAAGAAMATGGVIINYATLADYERETGNTIASFNEAPVLAALVAAGDLPPVGERLPDEPMVVSPKDAIGSYGGSIRAPALSPTTAGLDIHRARQQNLFAYESDFTTVVAAVATGWELNDDLSAITVSLRKGLKWSDGAPVTSADVEFAYRDILLNKELTPVTPGNLSPGGEFMDLEVIDDHTFRLSFAVPFPPILPILTLTHEPILLHPRHYLEQFHVSYNAAAEAEAQAAGFDNWYSRFAAQRIARDASENLERPALDTWVLDRVDSAGSKYYTRNPYFYKVDTAGNQLPYVDEQVRVLVENREVRTLKLVSGEFDYVGWDLPLKEYTLYKENEQAQGYRVMVWPQAVNGRTTYDFNYGYKDEVLRAIFEDLRFRQAMSLAIDREEVIKVLAFDRAEPMQAAALPNTSFYVDWTGDYFAEYDPDRANELLDEIGLEWNADRSVRLRPDGQPLQVTVETVHQVFVDYSELVKEYWEAVGVQVAVKKLESNLGVARREAGEIQVGVYYLGESMEALMFQNPGAFKILAKWGSRKSGRDWERWIVTGGAEGVQPPDDVIQLYDVASRWQQTEPGSDEYLQLGAEMLEIHARSLRSIGIIGMPPIPIVFNRELANTPTEGMWQGGPFMFMPYQAEQWYWPG